MSNPNTFRPSIRSTQNNPNHHLWSNHGTWWCHLTLQSDCGGSVRKRFSLKTRDIDEARLRRDRILSAIEAASGGVAA